LNRREDMGKTKLETPKIGDILKDEFLDPLDISAYRLAKEINVSTSSILDIVHNKRKLSVEMAIRFSKYFGNSSKFWLNLQNELDLREMESLKTDEFMKIKLYSHSA
jgi:addiction module HigA family antidote